MAQDYIHLIYSCINTSDCFILDILCMPNRGGWCKMFSFICQQQNKSMLKHIKIQSEKHCTTWFSVPKDQKDP